MNHRFLPTRREWIVLAIMVVIICLMFLIGSPVEAREYPCEVMRVVDGDTVDVQVDMGLGIHKIERVRLLGVWAKERNENGGPEATRKLAELLQCSTTLILRTNADKRDKYGRLLGEILCGDTNINHQLQPTIDNGPEE